VTATLAYRKLLLFLPFPMQLIHCFVKCGSFTRSLSDTLSGHIYKQKNTFLIHSILNVFGQYIDQIHYVFNESKKYIFAYKCARRKYVAIENANCCSLLLLTPSSILGSMFFVIDIVTLRIRP
jgi:hypothetical protein